MLFRSLDAAAITFHPVLEIVSCDGGGIPGATTETTAPVPASTVPAVDGKLCYVLGPEGGNGTDVRDAKVYADGVGIEVEARQDSAKSLNELFDACFEATDACPASSSEGKGYVAIVGLVNVKGALPATVTDLQVVIADGAAKLKALDAAGAEVLAEALSAQAVVFAKKG